MMFVLYTLHVLICFFLIAVVLLQQGKGADLSVFGGGGTQTAFGARGAATVLHKLSVGSFIAFIVTTLAIGVMQGDRSSSLIENLPEQPAATAEAEGEATDEAEEAGALEPGEAEEAGALDPAATGDDVAPAEEGADATAGDDSTGDAPTADASTADSAASDSPADGDDGGS